MLSISSVIIDPFHFSAVAYLDSHYMRRFPWPGCPPTLGSSLRAYDFLAWMLASDVRGWALGGGGGSDTKGLLKHPC